MPGVASSRTLVDILFIQDTTASMGPYIQSAKDSIIEVCQLLQDSGRIQKQGGLKVGLIAYRDYPPQDQTYITKEFPFTEDINEMHKNLSELTAEGGGDIPEAFCSALESAYKMKGWRRNAIKIIVVVTDAPPHGIGEMDDSIEGISPDGFSVEDPLKITRKMAKSGFTIMTLACEPTLSGSMYGTDFYKTLSTMTSGALYPLTNPKLLSACIIGSVLESADVQKLSMEYQEEIAHRFFVKKDPIDQIIRDIHKQISSAGQTAVSVSVENVYKDSPESKHNVHTLMSAKNLGEAKRELQRIRGSRFTPDYKQTVDVPEDKAYTITVTFKNTGASNIQVEFYEARDEDTVKKLMVPSNHMRLFSFPLNIPICFTLVRGRFRRNTSCTFGNDADFDVETKFELSS